MKDDYYNKHTRRRAALGREVRPAVTNTSLHTNEGAFTKWSNIEASLRNDRFALNAGLIISFSNRHPSDWLLNLFSLHSPDDINALPYTVCDAARAFLHSDIYEMGRSVDSLLINEVNDDRNVNSKDNLHGQFWKDRLLNIQSLVEWTSKQGTASFYKNGEQEATDNQIQSLIGGLYSLNPKEIERHSDLYVLVRNRLPDYLLNSQDYQAANVYFLVLHGQINSANQLETFDQPLLLAVMYVSEFILPNFLKQYHVAKTLSDTFHDLCNDEQGFKGCENGSYDTNPFTCISLSFNFPIHLHGLRSLSGDNNVHTTVGIRNRYRDIVTTETSVANDEITEEIDYKERDYDGECVQIQFSSYLSTLMVDDIKYYSLAPTIILPGSLGKVVNELKSDPEIHTRLSMFNWPIVVNEG